VLRAVRTYIRQDISPDGTTQPYSFSFQHHFRGAHHRTIFAERIAFMISLINNLLLQSSIADQRWLTDTTAVFDPQPIPQPPGGLWVHAIVLICFTLLVVLRVYDFRRISMLVQGFVRPAAVATLYREESALTSRVSFFLIVNFILMSTLFLWQAAAYSSELDIQPVAALWIALTIFGVYVVKIISTRMLGFVFEVKEAAREYAYNIVLFNKTVGLLLFPVTLLLAYARQIPSSWLIGLGLGLWGLVLLYRLLRLSFIGFSVRGVSIFYIILYLCTLEILPVLVIIKLLIKQH
jgi:hypothetical protein